MLTVPAASVSAGEAFVAPRLLVTQEYTDNLRLAPLNPIKTWITSVRPIVDFGYRLENFEIQGTARMNSLSYYSRSDFDIIERFFDLQSSYQTERNILNFTGGYSVESSLFTEIATTGNLTQIVPRTRWNLNPSWSFALNELQRLEVGYGYNNFTYDGDPAVTSLFNFETHQISLGLLNRLSLRDDLSGTVFLGRFNSEQADQLVNALQIEATWQHQFSEVMTASIDVGYIWVSSDFDTDDGRTREDSSDFTAAAYLERNTERSSFRMVVLRQLRPSGSGGIRDRKEANVGFTHELTRRWIISFRARAVTNESISQVRGGSKRDFITVSPRLSWNWTRKLALEVAYKYSWAKQNTQSGGAGNSVSLRVSYAPNPFTW